MQKVIAFAIFSTRRLEEITRIRRPDLEKDGSSANVGTLRQPATASAIQTGVSIVTQSKGPFR